MSLIVCIKYILTCWIFFEFYFNKFFNYFVSQYVSYLSKLNGKQPEETLIHTQRKLILRKEMNLFRIHTVKYHEDYFLPLGIGWNFNFEAKTISNGVRSRKVARLMRAIFMIISLAVEIPYCSYVKLICKNLFLLHI